MPGKPVSRQHVQLLQPLTPQELTVVRLWTLGKAPAQIAIELDATDYAMKAHTRRIYAKLGVSSRKEAIVRARELRLVEP